MRGHNDWEKIMLNLKTLAGCGLSVLFVAGCASAPKNIDLPQSSKSFSGDSVDGSAIAFQANHGQCNKSSLEISPRLSDGKYGPSEKIEISSSTFKLKSKSLKQDKYAASRSQLYVRPMAPGDYVITRLKCIRSMGDKIYIHGTNPERIDIFAEFSVEPGQTNYIGGLHIRPGFQGGVPGFTISDKSAQAKPFFDENYADRVGPMQTKLAKKTKASEAQDLLTRLRSFK